jgi:hypothetical protein
MQISWQQGQPEATNYELLWLSVSLTSLCASAAWFALGLPWPGCAFHSLTGWPCVTCGATRATIQFLHGHFFAALRWNPLVFVTLSGLSLFNVYAFLVLMARAPRLRLIQLSRVEKNTVRIAVVCLLASSWIYSLTHWRDF